jgi:RNA polymerase sigma-70 factor (ECF subfamily)
VCRRISPEAAKAVAVLFESEASSLFRRACTHPGVSRSAAEDLVQVTFQEAVINWERRLCCLDQESRRRWLYRILRNKAISQWRKDGSRQVPLDRLESAGGPWEETYSNALFSITLQRCWQIISAMPETRQRVAFLKWGEDWSNAEIAEFLGIAESTVRGHLKKARGKLAAEIGPDALSAGEDRNTGADEGKNTGEGVAS